MPRTPDRQPGVSDEEAIILEDTGVDPAVVGELRYNAGAFRLRDALGVFDPRSGSSVFGTQYQYAESEGDSGTSGAGFATKLTLTTTSLPAGTYVAYFYVESRHSAANKEGEISFRVDATEYGLIQPRPSAANINEPNALFKVLALTAGVHTLDIRYRRVDAMTITVRRARIVLWRVA